MQTPHMHNVTELVQQSLVLTRSKGQSRYDCFVAVEPFYWQHETALVTSPRDGSGWNARETGPAESEVACVGRRGGGVWSACHTMSLHTMAFHIMASHTIAVVT